MNNEKEFTRQQQYLIQLENKNLREQNKELLEKNEELKIRLDLAAFNVLRLEKLERLVDALTQKRFKHEEAITVVNAANAANIMNAAIIAAEKQQMYKSPIIKACNNCDHHNMHPKVCKMCMDKSLWRYNYE